MTRPATAGAPSAAHPWPGSGPGSADATLSVDQYRSLVSLLTPLTGIQLPPAKRVMLQSRLQRRLRALGLQSFHQYCALVREPGAPEVAFLVDAVTTNKTDFFREREHFEQLVDVALPRLEEQRARAGGRPLRVWSAGCSTGEEPYTLAMVLDDYARSHPGFQFDILATDICTTTLEHARRAIYDQARVEPVPTEMRWRYLMRSKDPARSQVRIVPELRARVELRRLNLQEPELRMGGEMDVIFCRNVFIYFDRPTQEAVLRKFCRLLAPGGYLFLGHSETIAGMSLPLTTIRPAFFRRTDDRPQEAG